MTTPHLILTVDYELFGNGSGCIESCVLSPASHIIQISEKYSAPITFFVEALEFIALSDQYNERRAQKQMRNALLTGHDVQLHLHPQWMNAVSNSDGVWILDMSRWRLGDLNHNDLRFIINQGKSWIESEIACDIPSYRCIAFRAGGWCIQPSNYVVKALLQSGFLIDSTVAPGQWRYGRGEWSDFRNVPDVPVWKSSDDVCQTTNNGIWEIPITVGHISKFRHLNRTLATRNYVNKGIAPGCKGSYSGPDDTKLNQFIKKFVRLTQLGSVMLDISTLSGQELIYVTQQWLEHHAHKNVHPIPIVAIAHTKNFTPFSEQALEEYLKWVSQQNIRLSTFKDWLESVKHACLAN